MMKARYHQLMYVIYSFLFGKHPSKANYHFIRAVGCLVRKQVKSDK